MVAISEMHLPCVINLCNISLHFEPWAQDLTLYLESSTEDEENVKFCKHYSSKND